MANSALKEKTIFLVAENRPRFLWLTEAKVKKLVKIMLDKKPGMKVSEAREILSSQFGIRSARIL